MITQDYNNGEAIKQEELHDLKAIADVRISDIILEEYPNLLVFPDSFNSFDRDFGKMMICNINDDEKKLYTNRVVGFVGRNKTHLSIHSRFTDKGKEDFFYTICFKRLQESTCLIFSTRWTMIVFLIF